MERIVFGENSLRAVVRGRVGDRVPITFGAQQSCTDGHGIFVADLPNDASATVRLTAEVHAYHEAQHVKELRAFEEQSTEKGLRSMIDKAVAPVLRSKILSMLRSSKREELVKLVNNVIEDIRVDNRANDEYPGTVTAYWEADRILAKDQSLSTTVDPLRAILFYMMYRARDEYYESRLLDPVGWQVGDDVKNLYQKVLGHLHRKVAKVSSYADTVALTKEVCKALDQAMQNQPPEPKGSKGKDSNGDSKGKDSEGKDSSEDSKGKDSEGKDSNGDSKGKDSEGKDSEGKDSEGKDSKGKDSNKDSEGKDSEGKDSEGKDSNGDSKGKDSNGDSKGKDSNGDSKGKDSSEDEPLIDPNRADNLDGRSKMQEVADKINSMDLVDYLPKQMNIRNCTVRTGLDWLTPGRHYVAGQEAKIRQLVLDEQSSKKFDKLKRGNKLEPKDLFRARDAKLGKVPRVWSRVQQGRNIESAVLFSVDESGSMSAASIAMSWQIVAALSRVLDSIKVKYAVNGWSSSIIQYYHRWDGTLDQRRLPPEGIGGGTPTADVIVANFDEISTRREPRKILLLFTDGDPNSRAMVKFVKDKVEIARKQGLFVFGFGIGLQDNHSRMRAMFGEDWVGLPFFDQTHAREYAVKILRKLSTTIQ